jgi:eukaryotic-like serine/threonine-protein kinase
MDDNSLNDRKFNASIIRTPGEEHQPLTRETHAPGTQPSSFGRFRVVHQVGAGVLGPVFRAFDPDTGRTLALKSFPLDLTPEQASRLGDEFRRLSTLDLGHPSLIAPIDGGADGSTAYLVEDYFVADSVDTAVRQYGPAPVPDALRLIGQLAGALDFAAAAGVHHGALHPRDVLVAPREVRLTGIGVAAALQAVGYPTPVRRPYSAPERAEGRDWGAAADVYSLAALGYELLTGRRPALSADQASIDTDSIQSPEPAVLAEAFARAFSPRPEDRQATALAFAGALKHALTGQPLEVEAERPRSRRASRVRKPAALPLEDAGAGAAEPSPVAPLHAADETVVPPAEAAPAPPAPEAIAPPPVVSDVSEPGSTVPEMPEPEPLAREVPEPPPVLDDLDLRPRGEEPFELRPSAQRKRGVGQRPIKADPQIDEEPRGESSEQPSELEGPSADAARPAAEAVDRPTAADAAPIDLVGRAVDADRAPDAEVAPVEAVRHGRDQPELDLETRSVEPGHGEVVEAVPGEPELRPADDRIGEPAQVGTAQGEEDDEPRRVPGGILIALLVIVVVGLGYAIIARRSSPSPSRAVETQAPAAAPAAGKPQGELQAAAPENRGPVPQNAPPTVTGPTSPPAGAPAEPVAAAPATARPPAASPPVATRPPAASAAPPAATPPASASGVPPPKPSGREGARASRSAGVSGKEARGKARVSDRAAGSAAAAAKPARGQVFEGSLSVVSRPSGARVFFDGHPVGTTPVTLPKVSAGSHVVRLESDGYLRWSSAVQIVAGRQVSVKASLDRAPR